MKIIFTSFCLLVLLAVHSQSVNKIYVDGEIYVKLKNDISVVSSPNENQYNISRETISFLRGLNSSFGVSHIARPFARFSDSKELTRVYHVFFNNANQVDQLIREITKSPEVEYAEKVPLDKPFLTPNDPSYSSQWALPKIMAEQAWDITTGNASIKVAVVDCGVELTHPDLAANIWTNPNEIANNGIDDDNNGYIDDVNGWNPVDNNNDANPPAGQNHGTEVAGIVAAKGNNGIGGASIGYNLSIIPVMCSTPAGIISYGDYGVAYAVAAKANVINMSFGGAAFAQTRQDLMTYAYSKGIVLVSSAGNGNVDGVSYPAGYQHVICVAATATDDSKASYSCYSVRIDVSAPGDNIYTTDLNSAYSSPSGTSMASPMVAGLCGLMLSVCPYLTPDDVLKCLKDNADNIDAQNPSYIGKMGAGRINAFKSVQCAQAALLWKPTAAFSSNMNGITAGGAITFKDLSYHNPTSWKWIFTGGSPATYVGQTPPVITYSNPGTYPVTLVAINANGADTLTKTSFVVISAGTCDLLNYNFVTGAKATWSPALYGDAGGFITGPNSYDSDKQKAQYINSSISPFTEVTAVVIFFAKGYSANMNKTVAVNVYDGTGGTPGKLIGTSSVSLQQIKTATGFKAPFQVDFKPALNLPVSKEFFVGVDYSNLNWTTNRDTFAILTNTNGQSDPSGLWEQNVNGTWTQTGTAGAYWNGLRTSMYLFPYLTNTPSFATFTTSATSICEGGVITYNSTGSTAQDTTLWYAFNSAGAPLVSSQKNPTINYPTAGTYKTILRVRGGGCHLYDSSMVTVQVNICTGINNLFTSQNINTYYNRSADAMDITVYDSYDLHGALDVKLIDQLGRIVYSGALPLSANSSSTSINTSTFAKGIYIVQLTGQNKVFNKKFILE